MPNLLQDKYYGKLKALTIEGFFAFWIQLVSIQVAESFTFFSTNHNP